MGFAFSTASRTADQTEAPLARAYATRTRPFFRAQGPCCGGIPDEKTLRCMVAWIPGGCPTPAMGFLRKHPPRAHHQPIW